GLAFGNDGDSMGSPGVGIDPRIMLDDMSSDPVRYAEGRLALLRETTQKLMDSYASDGSSYQALHNAYLMLGAELIRQANVTSRQIGGVHIDRAVQGQPGGTVPFTAVDEATQRRAMDFLARNVFSPDAFEDPVELYRHLQVQRRGFDFMGLTEDPKIHARALLIQKSMLDHLLNPVVMTRITDSGLYGNNYPLADMMQDLSRSIFAADMAGEVNAFRQALQLEYVNRLIAIAATSNAGSYDYPSRSLALYNLQQIRGWMSARAAGDTATRAHTAAVSFAIDKALDTA
ncbi:MAG: zinc-dependent metalloprotease, partial [Gammaproteobacteria bacterium]